MITINDPRIEEFLRLWHEEGRERFERECPNLNYDSYYPKTAKDRTKYLALDRGSSGVWLVDKATEEVWSIKGYGKRNRRVGTLEGMLAKFRSSEALRNAQPVARRATSPSECDCGGSGWVPGVVDDERCPDHGEDVSLLAACDDVLEWADRMGGWEATCWERLRAAVAAAKGKAGAA